MILPFALLGVSVAATGPNVLDISGCAVRPGVDTCVLNADRKLVILSSEPGAISYNHGDSNTEVTPEVIEGWFRANVVIPPHTEATTFKSGPLQKTMRWVPHPFPLADQVRLHPDLPLDLKAAVLSRLMAETSHEQRPYVVRAMARLEYASGRAQDSLRLLGDVISVASATNSLSTLAESSFAAAHINQQTFDFESAVATLGAVERNADKYLEGRLGLAFTRGNLSWQAGDLVNATNHFEVAANLAVVSKNPGLAAATNEQLGVLYIALGSLDRGLASIQKAAELGQGCQQAHSLTNLAWALYRHQRFDRANKHLEDALSLFETHCPGSIGQQTALINRGLIRVAEGLGQSAVSGLPKELVFSPELRLWRDYLVAHSDPNRSRGLSGIADVEEKAELHSLWILSEVAGLERVSRLKSKSSFKEAGLALAAILRRSWARERLRALVDSRPEKNPRLPDLVIEAVELLRRGGRDEEAASLVPDFVTSQATSSPRYDRAVRDWLSDYRRLRHRLNEITANDWKLTKDELHSSHDELSAIRAQLSAIAQKVNRLHGLPADASQLRWPREAVFVVRGRNRWLAQRGLGARAQSMTGTRKSTIDWIVRHTTGAIHIATARQVVGPVTTHLTATGQEVVLLIPTTQASRETAIASNTTTVFVDPREDLSHIRRFIEAQPQSDVRIVSGRLGTHERFRTAMERSETLVFVGHHESSDGEGRLQLAGTDTWSALDTRKLKHVPQRVVLIVCSGSTHERAAVPLMDELLATGVDSVTTSTSVLTRDLALSLVRQMFPVGAKINAGKRFDQDAAPHLIRFSAVR